MSALNLHLADVQRIFRGVQNATLHPLQEAFFYFFPFFAASNGASLPIDRSDCALTDMIPERVQRAALRELSELCIHAKLHRQVEFYTALNFEFESYGGSFSLTRPVIVIPYHYLCRPDGSYFGQESTNELILRNRETRFYLAREVCHLAPRDRLLKTATKVLLCTALYFLCAAPFGWAASLPLAFCTFGIQLFLKRSYEARIDLQAIDLCADALGDLKTTVLASLSALLRQKKQNLESRERNFWCRFYLTRHGNHLLDPTKPNLTSRIEKMQKILEELP